MGENNQSRLSTLVLLIYQIDKAIAPAKAGLNSGARVVPSYWKCFLGLIDAPNSLLAGPFALGHGREVIGFGRGHLAPSGV